MLNKEKRIFPNNQGNMPYIWLSFILIPILYLYPYSNIKSIFGLVFIILFVVAYRNSFFKSKYSEVWLICQYIISAIYTYLFGYSYLFIYPAWQIGFKLTNKKDFYKHYFLLLIFFAITFVMITPQLIYTDKTEKILVFVFSVFIVTTPLGARSIAKEINLRNQINSNNKRLESIIKQEERLRIARDLHDTLGQTLSIMTIKTELAGKLIDKNQDKAKQELKEIASISRQTLSSVREIVSSMRDGLIVEELVEIEKVLRSAKIILKTEGEEHLNLIIPKYQGIISFALRECVTNIIRHSKADYCNVEIQKIDNIYMFIIEDDGIGIDLSKKGNGINGLEERVKSIDGELNIIKNNGTRIEMIFKGLILEDKND